jgi:hypothetical protein
MIDENTHREAFVALQHLATSYDSQGSHKSGPTASRIVAYARRSNATANLTVERVLRSSPGARAVYAAALGRAAIASSLSVAAAADQVTERRIESWHLQILQEADNSLWLIIRGPEDAAEISMMELRLPDGTGRRLDLGAQIDGVFQLSLDPGIAEMVGLIEWLRNPATEIHLI